LRNAAGRVPGRIPGAGRSLTRKTTAARWNGSDQDAMRVRLCLGCPRAAAHMWGIRARILTEINSITHVPRLRQQQFRSHASVFCRLLRGLFRRIPLIRVLHPNQLDAPNAQTDASSEHFTRAITAPYLCDWTDNPTGYNPIGRASQRESATVRCRFLSARSSFSFCCVSKASPPKSPLCSASAICARNSRCCPSIARSSSS
jgi:hypothetical protein